MCVLQVPSAPLKNKEFKLQGCGLMLYSSLLFGLSPSHLLTLWLTAGPLLQAYAALLAVRQTKCWRNGWVSGWQCRADVTHPASLMQNSPLSKNSRVVGEEK